MFSGIVSGMGRILVICPHGDTIRIQVGEHSLQREAVFPGASIAVSGVCMTVEHVEGGCFFSTVSCTSLSIIVPYRVTQLVNLAPSVPMGPDVIHGLVSGHVDGSAILRRQKVLETGWVRFFFSIAHALQTMITQPGSVIINGVSVAVDTVDGDTFSVQVALDTVQKTQFGQLSVGQNVNIEVALITRYWMRYREVMATNQWAVG